MRYEVVFHPDHADPPFTLWLSELEGSNPSLALKQNLSDVMTIAQRIARQHFGADIFTEEELKDQIHVIDESGRWFAAENL
jgi:hypothetical protein